jgi:DNA polymerase
MPEQLSPELQKSLAARIQFYRDLGIHTFYRRGAASQHEESLVERAHAFEPLPVIQSATSVSGRLGELQVIHEDIGECTRCRLSKERKSIVFGVGNENADIMFVGEGPGADEDKQGLPFVGRAGQLLNNMISAMGIKREDVYIANVVKCRPPGNRTPERDECDTCSPFLLRQIQVIKPKVIVALGAVAAKNLLGVNDSMANLRGRFYDFRIQELPDTKLIVTYHPAYLLRDPRQKSEAWKDLKMVMEYLGMPLPQEAAKTPAK